MSNRPHARTAYVHVGTHKTGTTSIQAMLAANEPLFREAGVFVPQSGRVIPGLAGHHNIAWELAHDRRFVPADGTFDDVLHEAESVASPAMCLSSEDFEFLYGNAESLDRLRNGLREIGYTPMIVIYLRSQADYLESLYAEAARAWNPSFEDFFGKVLSDGVYEQACFDYDRFLQPFTDVFGKDRILVRAYRPVTDSDVLLREFTSFIAPTLAFERIAPPSRLNPRPTFPAVVACREERLGFSASHSMAPGQRFDPLDVIDIARLYLRFAASNRRLRRQHGVNVGCVTAQTLAREFLHLILRDRQSRHRKWLIRVLTESDLNIAA
jgi:hypothetical protein